MCRYNRRVQNKKDREDEVTIIYFSFICAGCPCLINDQDYVIDFLVTEKRFVSSLWLVIVGIMNRKHVDRIIVTWRVYIMMCLVGGRDTRAPDFPSEGKCFCSTCNQVTYLTFLCSVLTLNTNLLWHSTTSTMSQQRCGLYCRSFLFFCLGVFSHNHQNPHHIPQIITSVSKVYHCKVLFHRGHHHCRRVPQHSHFSLSLCLELSHLTRHISHVALSFSRMGT